MEVIAPDVVEPDSSPFKKVDRLGLLSNEAFLEEKCKSSAAAEWFRSLYLWLQTHPRGSYSRKGYWYQEGYWSSRIVLTAEGELLEGRNVWLPDFQPSDPILKDVTETLQKSRSILHPDILGRAKSEEERKNIRGFLTGLTGVPVLDANTVCKEALLPRILTTAPKPTPRDLLLYTIQCQRILGEEVGRGLEFWVLTKQGEVRAAREVFFPKEFKPERDWETRQQYVSGLNFLSVDYLTGVTNDDQLRAWRQFLKNGGIKDDPDNGVEEFAMNYAIEKLKAAYRNVKPVDKRNFGYDIEAETHSGETMRIEVKGLSHDRDVELDRNETETADKYRNSFYLCVVSEIPENPNIYLVKDPAAVGKKERVTIPTSIWKASVSVS